METQMNNNKRKKGRERNNYETFKNLKDRGGEREK